MTFKEYIPEAMKTAMYKNKEMQITCSIFGIFGEITETVDKVKQFVDSESLELFTHEVYIFIREVWKGEVAKEIGDVAWYLAALSDGFNKIPKVIPEFEDSYLLFEDVEPFDIGESLEMFKKIYRKYNYTDPLPVEYDEYIQSFLDWIYSMLSNEADALGFSLSAIFKLNLEKLSSRQERGVLHSEGDNR